MNTTQDIVTTEQVAAPAKLVKQPRKPRRMVREADGEGDTKPGDSTPPAALPSVKPASAQPTGTKSASVIALLTRPEGATLDEMIAATGWLPHTTRAALTGLKKKGHAVVRGKRGEVTCYRIAAA